MTPEQFERINTTAISVADLEPGDRTLLYGYDFARDTVHVYLKDGKIHFHRYNLRGHDELCTDQHLASEKWPACDVLVPSKRIYPERSDYAFCVLLMQKKCSLNFLDFDPLKFNLHPDYSFNGYLAEER